MKTDVNNETDTKINQTTQQNAAKSVDKEKASAQAEPKKGIFKSKSDRKIEVLNKLLAAEKAKSEETKKTMQYVQAEFENYKKRQDRDLAMKVKLSSSDIIIKLLPAVDNFEHTIANLKNSCLIDGKTKESDDNIIKGLEMVYSELLKVLKAEGLEEINPINEKFDPHFHEAMMQVESDQESMTILQVLQKGYKLHDKIIRHARVKVAK